MDITEPQMIEWLRRYLLMHGLPLSDKSRPVTGAADRIGHALAIACARAGADVFVHYGGSEDEASETQRQIIAMGRHAWILQADLNRAGRQRN